ncbi:MFS general substrate transporter [Ganoderma sinense ZZ0214-1]|uniref:MFS general substrate transporter n=1 Tax=Ganoderma sinense ZZ0214-1 TaxID=1077348 RepID=A0A2G8RPC9_9APHY|nr:MFS general substrate transporter [Ganoderma sinense ZZ0214-1]
MPQDLAAPVPGNGADENRSAPITPLESPKEIMAIEEAVPALAQQETDTQPVTKAMRHRAWIQFATLCWSIFVVGWNDGTTGPLVQRLQEVYHVSYAVVSLIFIASCVGFISGASSYLYVTDRFGFGLMVFIASFMVAIGNSLQASGSQFPVFVIGFLFVGFGAAFLDAGSNAFVASLSGDTSTKMGVMHAIYGVGAMCAPLISTQFAQLRRWSFGYLVHVGLVLMNAAFQAFTFRFKSEAECLEEAGEPAHEKTEDSLKGVNKYKQIFSLRAVHLMAFFLFTYVGVEVTIGGWIVTFVINERGGGASAGYISSGFWGGLTIGRLALLPINKKLGEWRVIFLYVLLSLALELVVWLVPSLIGGAVAVSFVGFFLGPIYPIVMNHAGSVLPQELISGAVGWMASFGAAGAAVFPFVTGALASGTSINSLQPLLIAMMGLMLVIWAFVPRRRIKST